MSILSVIQNVCLATGLDVPSQAFSSTDREMLELARLSNVVAKKIAKVYDWQALQRMQIMTGDGTNGDFDLPSDYDRMLKKASLWSSRFTWHLNQIPSADQWLEYQVIPYSLVTGNWIIYGGQFHILPVMSTGETVKFFYISSSRVIATGGTTKTNFTADTDSFVLDETLLELGMIWERRKNKGLAYAEDKMDYEIELGNLMVADKGSQPVVRSTNRSKIDARTYQGTVGGSTSDSLPDGYSIIIGEE